MSKKFLFLIALILNVGNSNCAAAKKDKENAEKFAYEHRHRMSSFEATESPQLVVKILNILLDELRSRRDIEMHHKETVLEEYRKMVLKKAEVLDKSKKADFKKFLMKVYKHFTSEYLNNNHKMVYNVAFKTINWVSAQLSSYFQASSIGSQSYTYPSLDHASYKIELNDLLWPGMTLTEDQVRDLQ